MSTLASPSANLLRLPVRAATARTSGLHPTGADPPCDKTNHRTELSGDPPCISAQRQRTGDAQQPLLGSPETRIVFFFLPVFQLACWEIQELLFCLWQLQEADSDVVIVKCECLLSDVLLTLGWRRLTQLSVSASQVVTFKRAICSLRGDLEQPRDCAVFLKKPITWNVCKVHALLRSHCGMNLEQTRFSHLIRQAS